jgi:hypothetical protein
MVKPAVPTPSRSFSMSKLLDHAVETVRALPPDKQDEIARAMLALAGAEPEPIDPAHLSAVLEGLAQASSREFATPAEVEAAFRRFGE